jgi:hypothetical protein
VGSHIIQWHDDLMNCELERMCKETVVIYFGLLSWNLPDEMSEMTKNLSGYLVSDRKFDPFSSRI